MIQVPSLPERALMLVVLEARANPLDEKSDESLVRYVQRSLSHDLECDLAECHRAPGIAHRLKGDPRHFTLERTVARWKGAQFNFLEIDLGPEQADCGIKIVEIDNELPQVK